MPGGSRAPWEQGTGASWQVDDRGKDEEVWSLEWTKHQTNRQILQAFPWKSGEAMLWAYPGIVQCILYRYRSLYIIIDGCQPAWVPMLASATKSLSTARHAGNGNTMTRWTSTTSWPRTAPCIRRPTNSVTLRRLTLGNLGYHTLDRPLCIYERPLGASSCKIISLSSLYIYEIQLFERSSWVHGLSSMRTHSWGKNVERCTCAAGA